MTTRQAQITRVLNEAADPRTGSRLLPLVYDELRELARARLAKEAPGQTLQATALPNHSWVLGTLAVSMVCSVHSSPWRTKMYTDP